jgi:hypothetical protein
MVGVEDQAGYFVGFVGDDGFAEESGQRKIGEGEARGYAFFLGSGNDAG